MYYLCGNKTKKQNIMTTKNLIAKLNKLNVPFTVLEGNGYNKDIYFSINGINFLAGFNEGQNVVLDFCREICYDNNSQEMQRRFFDNFNKVLKYANN